MDLEILEALALSEDRSAALAQLLPGSEDHDYYRALHAQHAGKLDDADAILRAWPERHGNTSAYERLRVRQLLYRLGEDPARVADEVRDRFGVTHWHEAEVAEVDPKRPSRLPDGALDPIGLLKQAAEASADLAQVTDEGIDELVAWQLDPSRRHSLLGRARHGAKPQLVELIAEDIAAKGIGAYGQLRVHDELSLEQLLALADKRAELRTHARWIEAVVRRMQPPDSVDLELDRDARERYLRELWGFVEHLSPAANSLKVHVLWHLLDTIRRRDAAPDDALFAAYLQLPRQAGHVSRAWLAKVRPEAIAQLGADFASATRLPPAGSDEQLVRDVLRRRIGDAERYAQWLEREWFDAEVAAAHLLDGTGDADRATLALGPARAGALRERVELQWCAHAPLRFGIDEPIVLEADVKHVPELIVKVFRIDPLAYFQIHRREVGTELDLDGLAASHELVMRFSEPAIRRVRRRIELPMCARPGTYVIDLIGNGMSSRAVVHKGRLRYAARIGAAGHAVTVLDEHGKPRPGARAWIGDREYIADERGGFTVPFSTVGGATPMLLADGEVATVERLALEREDYALELAVALDRQALTAGRTAHAIARLGLRVAGRPASLALLERATWDVTLTDRSGVETTKSQPLALSDDDAAVLEWPLGDDTSQVELSVRGTVRVVSTQRDQPLARSISIGVATMYGALATEALYLTRGDRGWVISALGKNGEPRGRRPVTVGLVHRFTRLHRLVELATDEQGRVELGELAGVTEIHVAFGAQRQSWTIEDPPSEPGWLHGVAGRALVLALPASREPADALRHASLVELRGGAPLRQAAARIEPLAGAIAIRGLVPGDYALRAHGIGDVSIRIVPDGTEIAGQIATPGAIVELARLPPAVAELGFDGGALRVRIAGAGPRTRVHVIATRFLTSPAAPLEHGARRVVWRGDRARGAHYVSGRELGDEYRYVMERRAARRFPGMLLERPSLLLDPWPRRATTTDVATARPGDAFAPSPARAAAQPHVRGRAAMRDQAQDASYVGYDFLAEPPAVLANLVLDDAGALVVPLAELGAATCATVLVDDPAGFASRRVALAEGALEPRDQRLALALDPAHHASERKQIAALAPGEALVIEDLATAKLHLVDSIERAHAYLLALRDDPTLREFAFVTRWHAIGEAERRELYAKHACHELRLFLYVKDRAWFDAVIRPYLANKRTRTFVDDWLLDADLAPYLAPDALARLNAFERALLALRLPAEPALVRLLEDAVAVLPPDPAGDARLIDALIGASTLDGDAEVAEATTLARAARASEAELDDATGEYAVAMAAPMEPPAPRAAPPRPAMIAASADKAKKRSTATGGHRGDDELGRDLEERAAAPMFRAADRTQEWAEHNWWHRTPHDSGAEMIPASRLWRDLARHRGGAFVSPWLGLATGSFAEAMCALAVTDLPFVAGKHAITADGPKLTIVAGDRALAGSSQLVRGELVVGGAPLVLGQSYVRADDRQRWVDGQQVDKYVEGELAAGTIYTCQVVIANPTSSRQRVAALVQIPRGSLPLGGARATHTLDVLLEPYGTHGHEYSFYFPEPGRYGHFPVHVTRGGEIVAAAPARPLDVTAGGAARDPQSWPELSQRGSIADVVGFLERENLAAIALDKIAWRMRERAAYDAIVSALERRRGYDATLWGYALYHRDRPRIRVWLRALAGAIDAGPVLDMPIVGLDDEALGRYEHLEHAPLVNARAHRLGARLRILNDGLRAQYERMLALVAHRHAPTDEDLLAAASYLLAQDRIEPALGVLARVRPDAIAERMQHDYLAAYAACLVGEPGRARELAARWRDLPIDRWRRRFEALSALLAELEGAAPTVVDPDSRDQLQAELAARQPAFDLALDRDGVVLRHQHVAALELRFFEMDVELLFSRQPFVQSDVSRFSFIEPGHREQLASPPPELRVAWPAPLRGKNVVVEAVGAGQRKAKIHYANDLATSLAHQYGQIRVQRASDRGPLPATYVKVYARRRGGQIAFYKDGYTDLRGWFDYATLSTDELDHVERFAILVCSDHAGAAILETNPPAR